MFKTDLDWAHSKLLQGSAIRLLKESMGYDSTPVPTERMFRSVKQVSEHSNPNTLVNWWYTQNILEMTFITISSILYY
ncbi:hypothetical protein [Arenibacter echinorum]|uniref:Uncharacterized protein n=1 Tax=Arenibacter echinorum TaxID=440515 RepID=A0A327QYV3_9FLAO|nr:hypothetical protein [Arenibacter echinorum]RAJ09175.1 hypothetical protein LV92_03395 [Arenibacter echinorum]